MEPGGVPLLGTLRDMYRKALEAGVFLHKGPVWTIEGKLLHRGLREKGETSFHHETVFTEEFERYIQEGRTESHEQLFLHANWE